MSGEAITVSPGKADLILTDGVAKLIPLMVERYLPLAKKTHQNLEVHPSWWCSVVEHQPMN